MIVMDPKVPPVQARYQALPCTPKLRAESVGLASATRAFGALSVMIGNPLHLTDAAGKVVGMGAAPEQWKPNGNASSRKLTGGSRLSLAGSPGDAEETARAAGTSEASTLSTTFTLPFFHSAFQVVRHVAQCPSGQDGLAPQRPASADGTGKAADLAGSNPAAVRPFGDAATDVDPTPPDAPKPVTDKRASSSLPAVTGTIGQAERREANLEFSFREATMKLASNFTVEREAQASDESISPRLVSGAVLDPPSAPRSIDVFRAVLQVGEHARIEIAISMAEHKGQVEIVAASETAQLIHRDQNALEMGLGQSTGLDIDLSIKTQEISHAQPNLDANESSSQDQPRPFADDEKGSGRERNSGLERDAESDDTRQRGDRTDRPRFSGRSNMVL